MPGPPPSRNPRRRNARPDWRVLPAAGRDGRAPRWPLPPVDEEKENAKRRGALWRQLWATPQAVAWEALGWTRIVARYTQLVLEAEQPGASTGLLAEVRQLEDRIGLTPMSMKRLQWEVGPVLVDEPRDEPAKVTQLDEYRDLYVG